MSLRSVSLDDKFDLAQDRVLVTGYHALIRALLMQKERDRRAGLNTGGYVTGYRGSPLGGLDQQMMRAGRFLAAADVKFQPGLNEELAATALWGSQQAELRGEGKFDGVFGIWYGKGPGVDRSGDVFRHANLAGTARARRRAGADGRRPHRGILHHRAPVRIPFRRRDDADPQPGRRAGDHRLRALRLGHVALHRHLDRAQMHARDGRVRPASPTAASTASRSSRPAISRCRKAGSTSASTTPSSARKRACTITSATPCSPSCAPTRSTSIVTSGGRNPKVGIITTGKSYLDVRQALDELGIDEVKCNDLGLRLFKIGCVWPIARQELADFAQGLDLIIVVEEKRSLIEVQVREELYGSAQPAGLHRQEGRAGQLAVPGQGRARPERRRGLHRRAAVALRRQRRTRRQRGAAEIGAARARRNRRRRPAHSLFLLRLPAQHLDARAGRQPRLCRHRLPLHVAVDGPQDARLHPDGRRGRQLDRRGAVLKARARVPEPGRRHLQSLGLSRHSRRHRLRRDHDLQDSVQRRGRHDRRPGQ